MNPRPVTGYLEVLTVQAGPRIPLSPRGVIQAIVHYEADLLRATQHEHNVQGKIPRHWNQGNSEPRADAENVNYTRKLYTS